MKSDSHTPDNRIPGPRPQALSTARPAIHRLPLPDIPRDRWCDFRREYEAGMSLKAIAAQHICDPRTVRRLLLLNKGSEHIGQQHAPTVLDPWVPLIQEQLQTLPEGSVGICTASRAITARLRQDGYTGSERTVRNYLRSRYHIEAPDT